MHQSKRTPLARAISAALTGSVVAASALAPAHAQELEEIIVTAQKRTENLQDVPVSVQVLGNTQLQNLHVNGFEDYIEFLPTVSYETQGPGVGQLYMRGISSGGDGVHSGSMPSVGVYLDEQPVTTIFNILDVHIYDIERIETLAGPQGTFFGASSQAGTLRIITRKPVIGEFEMGFDAGADATEEGDPGYTVEGFLNIPVSGNSAIRLVGWHEYEGGYIDNVPGSVDYVLSGESIENSALVDDDYNDVETTGLRALLKIDLNENWTATPGLIYQEQYSDGVFFHDPEDIGDLQVQRFFPDYYDEQWYQASLTLEGRVGNVDMIYAGAYLDRDVDNAYDYVNYSEFKEIQYQYLGYACYHYDSLGNCTDPSQWVAGDEKFNRQSHELRFQTPQDRRLRAVAGLFYQRQVHDFDLQWVVPDLDPVNSVIENGNIVWQTKQIRVDRDKAVFGEVSYDATDRLTLIGGYRWFDFENSLFGFNGWVGRCTDANGVPQYPCFGVPNVDDVSDGDGDSIKLSVTYDLTDDHMIYATLSEGFRAGGVNRASEAGVTLAKYGPDFVDNYEVGWKTTWLDGRMRFNGAAYLLEWENFQFSFLDQTISPLTIISNIGQARTIGSEFDLTFAATDNLTLQLAGSYNDAELREPYFRNDEERDDPDFPPRAPEGTRMPFVPEIQATFIGRYNFRVGQLPWYAQAAVSYTDDSWNDLEVDLRMKQADYTIVNVSTGLEADDWTLDVYVNNLTDKRAQLVRNSGDYFDPLDTLTLDTTIVVNRPRSYGIRYSRRF